MPQRKCSVKLCPSTQAAGVVLHAFPNPASDEERFRKWVTNVGISGEDDSYIFKNRRICHLHFDKIYHYPKNRLSRLAVPRLHLEGPLSDVTNTALQLMVIDVQQPSSSLTASSVIGQSLSLTEFKPKTQAELKKCKLTNTAPVINVQQPSSSASSVNGKSLQFKRLTSTEFELYKTVAKTQAELRRCKKTKAGLVEKLKVAKKFSLSEAYKLVTKDLTPTAKAFFDMQLRQAQKNPKGRRFSLDEKVLALSLYKPSPKAYRILSQICPVLPKKNTLNKLLKLVRLVPGPNDIIFEHLTKRVEKMPNSHRYCTLIFDEMAVEANLSYDKNNDSIKGFCDDGNERNVKFADHVLVFMIRGIFKKFKQTISYTFCGGTTSTQSLKQQIQTVLKKVLATGLKVVSTTCDQGATNMAAINSLINDTKKEYLRREKEFKGGFFEIDNNQIFPIFDPPHLLKGIRNNLITKNLEYVIDGQKRTAKWAHLVALYKKSPGYKGVCLVPKLTARHVLPELIPKMKVKYSTQVFSRTVSVAMGFTAGTGRIPRESTETADLLMFFDKLFDSVNGSFSKPIKGKIYRSAVSPKSPHHKLWYKSLPILKSMKFVGARAGLPSISSWIKTIQAFQQITKKMHDLGLKSLLLRNFNQDPLENFFGAIRAHGQGNIMPSCTAFEAAYSTLLINNMTSPKSVGANCESDDAYCLQSLKYFLNKKIEKPIKKNIEIDLEHLNMDLPDIDDLLNSESPNDVEKCAAAAY